VSKSLFYSNKNTPVSTTMSIRLYKNILNKGEWFIMKKMDKKELVNTNGGDTAIHCGSFRGDLRGQDIIHLR